MHSILLKPKKREENLIAVTFGPICPDFIQCEEGGGCCFKNTGAIFMFLETEHLLHQIDRVGVLRGCQLRKMHC